MNVIHHGFDVYLSMGVLRVKVKTPERGFLKMISKSHYIFREDVIFLRQQNKMVKMLVKVKQMKMILKLQIMILMVRFEQLLNVKIFYIFFCSEHR